MVVGGGSQSHFRVQPNNCVEVVLYCVVVGTVTTFFTPDGAVDPILQMKYVPAL